MRYRSTRGPVSPEKSLDFSDILLKGLAPDGGLYLPVKWPEISKADFQQWRTYSFPKLCAKVMQLFAGSAIEPQALEQMCERAYGASSLFRHKAVAPLVEVKPALFSLELFHGPTLAFKDMAMQLLGELFAYVLEKKQQHITLIAATSGDTGSAAIAAFQNRPRIKLVVLHPHHRTSDIQRRQMTTVSAENILNIAVPGNFDICQDIVKKLLKDQKFREETALSAVNSINWARIAIQTAYFIRAALVLGAPERRVSFSVPTGNFGNVFAAWVAKKMGLEVSKLVIGSNQNDILTRFIQTGEMKVHSVSPSYSPSMDIQYSSNFERLLFESLEEDPENCRKLMETFQETGSMILPPQAFAFIRKDFEALALSDFQTLEAIRKYDAESHYLADPHSVIALSAGEKYQSLGEAMICAATAHPAKFPQTMAKACRQSAILPDQLVGLEEKKEFFKILPPDFEIIRQEIKNFSF
ncbi:threonine synthase [Acetobacteraceae bacterium]|nr:threonine synthase [Acetobacteraceae bacterium]